MEFAATGGSRRSRRSYPTLSPGVTPRGNGAVLGGAGWSLRCAAQQLYPDSWSRYAYAFAEVHSRDSVSSDSLFSNLPQPRCHPSCHAFCWRSPPEQLNEWVRDLLRQRMKPAHGLPNANSYRRTSQGRWKGGRLPVPDSPSHMPQHVRPPHAGCRTEQLPLVFHRVLETLRDQHLRRPRLGK